MKMRQDHVVPLPATALAILDKMGLPFVKAELAIGM